MALMSLTPPDRRPLLETGSRWPSGESWPWHSET